MIGYTLGAAGNLAHHFYHGTQGDAERSACGAYRRPISQRAFDAFRVARLPECPTCNEIVEPILPMLWAAQARQRRGEQP